MGFGQHCEGVGKPGFFFFLIFIVIQLQLYAFSPHPSTPPPNLDSGITTAS